MLFNIALASPLLLFKQDSNTPNQEASTTCVCTQKPGEVTPLCVDEG